MNGKIEFVDWRDPFTFRLLVLEHKWACGGFGSWEDIVLPEVLMEEVLVVGYLLKINCSDLGLCTI